MVVGYRDSWDIANDIHEISAELKPVGIMPVVVIDLVSGKEQKVRFQLFDIRNDICFRYVSAVSGIDWVAGESGDDNRIFIDRVFEDCACIICVLAVSEAVFDIFSLVPALNAEMRRPAVLDYLRLSYLLPSPAFPDLEPDTPVLTIF